MMRLHLRRIDLLIFSATTSPQTRSTVAGEVGADMLEQLPVLDQDYISTFSMFLDSGSTGTGGVSLVVDGMEASRLGVSPSAIQQVKINNDPYAAEYFRPGRGRIEVITKP